MAGQKKDNKRDDLWVKVYIVYAFALLFAIAIVVRMFIVVFGEGEELLKQAKEQSLRYEQVRAVRGNIYSSNATLLAASVPIFTVRMDLNDKVVSSDTFRRYIRPLCDSLHRMYPQVSSAAYRRNLEKARREGKRNHLIKRNMTYSELKRMQTFPIFNKGQFKGGFIVEEGERRSRPNDPLGARTIGYYNADSKYGVGLEASFNSELEGVSGRRLTQRVGRGVWRPIYSQDEEEPQNGLDIVSTIDTRIQDVAHAALTRCMEENEAQHGCAVLMEVSTGKIVAIANLTKRPDGTYSEIMNYAVGESVEPGSTFKLASAIAILEEGRCDTSTLVPTGVMEFYGRKMIDSRRSGYGEVSFQTAFDKSSNVGISYLAHEIFHENPQKFIDYLHKMHLNEKMGVAIKGEGEPYIKNKSDKTWSKLTLPWMSIGYELRLTPLQILCLYNAVANGGKMMQPQLVTHIKHGDRIVKEFEAVVLKDKIASKRTIDLVHGMLESAVQRGTAHSLSKSPYRIAGKTGTAQINYASRGEQKMTYRASFAGYFPADNPMYSCIVMITNPQKNRQYGGEVAAPVFKEIADKVYATLLRGNREGGIEIAAEQMKLYPNIAFGYGEDIKRICNSLGYSSINGIEKTAFLKIYRSGTDSILSGKGRYAINRVQTVKEVMPNVLGLGARDAVYLLERHGLKVQISGRGRIKRQSIEPGMAINTNTAVLLELE